MWRSQVVPEVHEVPPLHIESSGDLFSGDSQKYRRGSRGSFSVDLQTRSEGVVDEVPRDTCEGIERDQEVVRLPPSSPSNVTLERYFQTRDGFLCTRERVFHWRKLEGFQTQNFPPGRVTLVGPVTGCGNVVTPTPQNKCTHCNLCERGKLKKKRER